ncbi:MAG: GNAT family N-acetyltransferase [Methanocellales archaeon]|nr:GNAT family N-acetyltransferase [Methanocellales archaeon]MDD3420967.1 GNAT family N-acetyltransferase [Methanocellales archaeon]MDD4898672.1 GNAT family N-acetyltransferase [Methanocellales archaeon]MDD5446951.1 GNAT family N-acetyltransferase [Methanocellales archaeon]
MNIGILYNLVEEGKLQRGVPTDIVAENEVLDAVSAVKASLEHAGHEVLLLRVSSELLGELNELDLDVIFNLAEGLGGDTLAESKIAALLELLKIPYTGSNSRTLAICHDKFITKNILVSQGILTPAYQLIMEPNEPINTKLSYPLIVKPVWEDSSIGIGPDSVVYDEEHLRRKIRHILEVYLQPALVEEFIDGRELNVAILGSGGTVRALPLSEIVFNLPPGEEWVVSYEAKWIEGSKWYEGTCRSCPAELDPDTAARVKDLALKAYRAVGCSGYGRVDIRLREGIPYVLEVNPNPCLSPGHSGFVASIEADGMTFGQLVDIVLQSAIEKGRLKERSSDNKSELIKTKNLTMRPVKLCDVDILLSWFNDAENLRFMDDSGQISRGYLERELMKTSNDFDFIVSLGDKPIGFASVYNVDGKNMRGEISILIGETELQGRGYGSEIIMALLRFAFEKLMLHSLFASATVLNESSQRILAKAGFRKIGTRREYHKYEGEFLDEIFFDITEGDYKAMLSQFKTG